MNAEQRAEVEAILAQANDLTIATLRGDGYPQATTVSYVSDGLTIYFGVGVNSQKARNIARDPRVSLTVNLPYKDWNEIRGVSIGARARRVSDPEEMAKAGALMVKKFPQVVQHIQSSTPPDEMAFVRVDPEVVSILDYRKGFGHTELLRVS